MSGQKLSFPVFGVGPRPRSQGSAHRISTHHDPGVLAKYVLLCCLHSSLVTSHVLAQYRLGLLGNARELAGAALLAVSQFNLAAVLFLFEIRFVMSMNY